MTEEISFVYIGEPSFLFESGCYDQCDEYGDCSPMCQGE